MVNDINCLHPKDKLNVYLVAQGLKPAALVDLNPVHSDTGYPIRKDGAHTFIYAENEMPLRDRDISAFEARLDELGLAYAHDRTIPLHTLNEHNQPVVSEMSIYHVGGCAAALESLVQASTDEEYGAALGYPCEAIAQFRQFVDGEQRDGVYLGVCLGKAKKAGIELPTWLAYLSHVPEQLDLVNDDVSESSRALGLRYQSFVREHNPELAAAVEKHFLDTRVPDHWTMDESGMYTSLGYGPL